MLERFVFRRDNVDDGSFPDEAAAPLRASSVTSLGDPFTIALLPAAPPSFSRLYVHWPREPIELLSAHGDLLLLSLADNDTDRDPYWRDYFVFNAALGALKRLPACTEPMVVEQWGKGATMKRHFNRDTIGIYCGMDGDFTGSARMGVELCVFRSPPWATDDGSHDDVAKGEWKIMTLPIIHTKEEFADLTAWSTDATTKDCVIWVDYHQGGIMSYNPRHDALVETRARSSISYSRLPINNRPRNSSRSGNTLEMYRSLCVVPGEEGNQLKFVDVARDDEAFFGPLAASSSFTITFHTRASSEDNVWHKEAVITSQKFQYLVVRKRLLSYNVVPMFPLVNRDEPNHIHFIVSEPRDKVDKLSVVVIDIIKETLISVSPYIQGEEDLSGKDADMVRHRCRLLRSFLPVSSQACSNLISHASFSAS
ncbi:hypothetical protein VPH35_093489 [Triticum aestivum]